MVAIRNRHVARGRGARAARQPRVRPARRPTRWRSASPTTATPSRAPPSSPQRLEFDLTQELGYRYPDFSDRDEPAIAELTKVCNRAFEARYRNVTLCYKGKARARLDEELALIGDLGLAGFFLLHWEVLELAADVAREVRGRETPRHSLPPGRGRGSSVGSLVCYLTGPLARRPGRRRTSRSGVS